MENYASHPVRDRTRKNTDTHLLKKNLRPFGSVQKSKQNYQDAYNTPMNRPAKLPSISPAEFEAMKQISIGSLTRDPSVNQLSNQLLKSS